MSNVKQLKMNKFVKYVWQLIISTSNATREAPSLRPWDARREVQLLLLCLYLMLKLKKVKITIKN